MIDVQRIRLPGTLKGLLMPSKSDRQYGPISFPLASLDIITSFMDCFVLTGVGEWSFRTVHLRRGILTEACVEKLAFVHFMLFTTDDVTRHVIETQSISQ